MQLVLHTKRPSIKEYENKQCVFGIWPSLESLCTYITIYIVDAYFCLVCAVVNIIENVLENPAMQKAYLCLTKSGLGVLMCTLHSPAVSLDGLQNFTDRA